MFHFQLNSLQILDIRRTETVLKIVIHPNYICPCSKVIESALGLQSNNQQGWKQLENKAFALIIYSNDVRRGQLPQFVRERVKKWQSRARQMIAGRIMKIIFLCRLISPALKRRKLSTKRNKTRTRKNPDVGCLGIEVSRFLQGLWGDVC